MELGWTQLKRLDHISYLTAQPTKNSRRVDFQGKTQELAVHSVPIGFPKYRLDNGRTRSAQAAYLARHSNLPKNFFSSDLESEEAQRVQHELLKSMLGKGEKELLRYFKIREQSEPLLLTHQGFVLNGNRRLCAMRELINTDRQKYEDKFRQIEIIILPPADERELDRLEARLQLNEDIKQDYSWTAKAYMLRSRKEEHGFDEKALSALYEISVPNVREYLDMLTLAEAYLEDRNKPNQFEIVDKHDYAFRQLLKSREQISSEVDRDIFERIAFCLIDAPAEGRLYATIPDAAAYLSEIKAQIKAEIPTAQETVVDEAAELLGLEKISVDATAQVVRQEGNYDAIREIAYDVIETEKLKAKEKKKGNRVLTKLTKAHELLQDSLSNWKSPQNLSEVKAVVEKLIVDIEKLRDKLNANNKN